MNSNGENGHENDPDCGRRVSFRLRRVLRIFLETVPVEGLAPPEHGHRPGRHAGDEPLQLLNGVFLKKKIVRGKNNLLKERE
jgi:hypothetical protein